MRDVDPLDSKPVEKKVEEERKVEDVPAPVPVKEVPEIAVEDDYSASKGIHKPQPKHHRKQFCGNLLM
jgi:hypothetical protein